MRKCAYCRTRITLSSHPSAVKKGEKWFCCVNHVFLYRLKLEQKAKERAKKEQARKNQKMLADFLKDWC